MPRTHLSCLTREEQRSMLFRTDVLFPWFRAVEWKFHQSQFLDNTPYPERLGELVQCPRHVLEAYVRKTNSNATHSQTMDHLCAIAAALLDVNLGVQLSEQLQKCFTKASANAAIPVEPQRCWPTATPEPTEVAENNPATLFHHVHAGERYTFSAHVESTYVHLCIVRDWSDTEMRKFFMPGGGSWALGNMLRNLLTLINSALSYQGLELQYESANIETKFKDAYDPGNPWPESRLQFLLSQFDFEVPDHEDIDWTDHESRDGEFVEDLEKADGTIRFIFRVRTQAQPNLTDLV